MPRSQFELSFFFLFLFHCAAVLSAQSESFESPIELKSKANGFTGFLYPSPVMRDWNQDGSLDLVIGDLFGKVRLASSSESSVSYSEIRMMQADNKPLKLNNW